MRELVGDADTVINLVGILHETGRETFARAHVELRETSSTRADMRACAACAHERTWRGADAPSRYLRSKGEAQALVEASALDWTVFRPSVIFGRGDSFLSLFAKLVKGMPIVILAAPERSSSRCTSAT